MKLPKFLRGLCTCFSDQTARTQSQYKKSMKEKIGNPQVDQNTLPRHENLRNIESLGNEPLLNRQTSQLSISSSHQSQRSPSNYGVNSNHNSRPDPRLPLHLQQQHQERDPRLPPSFLASNSYSQISSDERLPRPTTSSTNSRQPPAYSKPTNSQPVEQINSQKILENNKNQIKSSHTSKTHLTHAVNSEMPNSRPHSIKNSSDSRSQSNSTTLLNESSATIVDEGQSKDSGIKDSIPLENIQQKIEPSQG